MLKKWLVCLVCVTRIVSPFAPAVGWTSRAKEHRGVDLRW
jgi:hypothetical protein